MNEQTFREALDEGPDNFAMYLVFADWLEESGDWRAPGYRWMGESKHRPRVIEMLREVTGKKIKAYEWFNLDATGSRQYAPHRLPGYLFYLLRGGGTEYPGEPNLYYKKRKDAEEALCKAVCKQLNYNIQYTERDWI
jgi:uncharacterized protein (TIGR02996 family)